MARKDKPTRCPVCGYDGPTEEEESITLDPGETRPVCGRCGWPVGVPR